MALAFVTLSLAPCVVLHRLGEPSAAFVMSWAAALTGGVLGFARGVGSEGARTLDRVYRLDELCVSVRAALCLTPTAMTRALLDEAERALTPRVPFTAAFGPALPRAALLAFGLLLALGGAPGLLARRSTAAAALEGQQVDPADGAGDAARGQRRRDARPQSLPTPAAAARLAAPSPAVDEASAPATRGAPGELAGSDATVGRDDGIVDESQTTPLRLRSPLAQLPAPSLRGELAVTAPQADETALPVALPQRYRTLVTNYLRLQKAPRP